MNSCIDYYKYRNLWIKEKIYNYYNTTVSNNYIKSDKHLNNLNPIHSKSRSEENLINQSTICNVDRNNKGTGERRGGILLIHEDKILVIHQIHSGYWGFPKGRLEENELPISGAKRELEEETGIKDIIIPDQQPLIINISGPTFMFIVNISFKPEVYPDYIEIDGYQWVTLDDLKKLPISYLTKKIIKKLEKNPIF